MTATLAQIWRHPIKGHGAEPLDRVTLSKGCTMPWDRYWAVAHEAARDVPDVGWARHSNFSRGASAPGLMAITSTLDEERGTLTLRHPELADFTFTPGENDAAFLAWSAPLIPDNRAASARITSGGAQGITDSKYPTVSILSLSSLKALGDSMGKALDPRRFRGNLWIDGLDAWEETSWVGRTLGIGPVSFEITERIERCRAPDANPATGRRDALVLDALERIGMDDLFGVFGVVQMGGAVAPGDEVTLQ